MAFGLSTRQILLATALPICLALLLAGWQCQFPGSAVEEVLFEDSGDIALELIQKKASKVLSSPPKVEEKESIVTETPVNVDALIQKEATNMLKKAKANGLDSLAFLEEVYQATRQHLDNDKEVEKVQMFTEQLKKSKFMREVYEKTYQELLDKIEHEQK
eukprot:CAMPEP_0169118760 /NCGR_PEP_ID=MMETSP1015-20121227/31172_1 /TAXON_ID=342587 /ORGANISM="Karlodinium micrum, Strain CCMP2283" /LENGTH=159 /DNA_ID=CAMNT_0009181549 /DNA_START=70 /DNA_END=549 /DNA_ORIENTATION=-